VTVTGSGVQGPRETKRALREALLRDRAALMTACAGTARLAIRDRYLSAFEPSPGTVVSAFWPMPGELDLRPLLDGVADTVRPLIAKKHLHLAVDVEADDGPVVAFADEGLVKQVLLNLLSNAVKFTPAGGTISVGARVASDAPEAVEVRVEDTGIGIPQRDLPRIFERFYRVDQARSRETGGTGLGLAIVRHVSENHGGQVDVSSELGRGSVFEVRLPTTVTS